MAKNTYYKVILKTNNGTITWSTSAANEEEAKNKAVKEIIKEMEISGYKVQEIEKLEEVSVETTLQDVKKYDPQLYKTLKEEQKTGKSFDADAIQAATVKKIFVEAPSEKAEARKPTLQDLDTGGDIYDKYKWERK